MLANVHGHGKYGSKARKIRFEIEEKKLLFYTFCRLLKITQDGGVINPGKLTSKITSNVFD